MKTIICVIVVVALICGGTAAYAGDVYFSPPGATGDWNVDENWHNVSCGVGAIGVPDITDNAIICTGKTCTMDISDEVMTISTEETGKLIIPAAYTLTLNEDEGVSTNDGTIELSGEIHIVIDDENAATQEWHQFAGSGEIIGEANTAKILIQSIGANTPAQLILSSTIRGMGLIGKLVAEENDQQLVLMGGSVIADDHGTLRINTGSMDDEAGSERSLLKASTFSDAVLQIDVGCEGTPAIASFCVIFCLEYTDMEILEGTVDLDSTIETEGDLTMEPGGRLDVEDGSSAGFRLVCSS